MDLRLSEDEQTIRETLAHLDAVPRYFRQARPVRIAPAIQVMGLECLGAGQPGLPRGH